MSRVNFLLLAALLVSCLYLVKTSHDARRLFAALDRAKNQQTELDVEFKRLDAQAKVQATHLRVEKVARERLHMRNAGPAITQYVSDLVSDPGAAASAVAAAGDARP